jgi:hypothetical protein
MGTWEEEWLDMTKDKQGMTASSPQKIESWQQELLDTTKYMQNGLSEDWSVPIPGLGPISMEQAQGTQRVEPTPPTPSNPSSGGGGTGGEVYLVAGSGSTSSKPSVKIATPQYVNFQDDRNLESADFLKMLYFEQINGAMLLSLTNNANLNTESINYQPIVNMAEIQQALDPKGILALQNTSDKYFLNFPIKLETKIPNYGNGPAGTNVYINFSTGNLVIENININPGEKIEIETLRNGTIYETDLGVDTE